MQSQPTESRGDAQPQDTRLDHVHAMVQATSFERHALWCMNAKDSPYSLDGHPGLAWDQDSMGFMRQIGEIDGRPVVVSVSFAVVSGRPVCFYDSTGTYVDWKQVEAWARRHGVEHVDASNFHNAFHGDADAVLLARFRGAQDDQREAAGARFMAMIEASS